MPTIADALSGSRYTAPAERQAQNTALVAGAAGRLGERVLARLLAAPGYSRIYALAAIPMPSTESKLATVTSDGWDFRIDDVIAVAGEDQAAGQRSRKRTDVFSPLSYDQIIPLALRAKAAGVRRFVVVTPIHVLSQPAALYANLANPMEAQLHHLGFESLILLRPSDQALRRRTSGIARRILNLIVDTATGLMVGLRHTPLTIDDTARAVVRAVQDSPVGLTIIETDRLHGLLKS